MAFDPDEYLNETGASSTATAEFDPDAYLSETEEQEAPFDPDAYLAEVETPAQPKPPVGTSFIEELAAIPQAIKQSIDQPLEAMGETAEVLGASGIGGALRGAIEGPEGYVPAAQRFMEPQEGEFQVAGFAPQFLPRAIVEQAGQIGGAILTRAGGMAIGGLAGSALGPKGTVAGAAVGAFIGPALFEMGQIVGPVARERAANQGREEPTTDDLAWAWATAGTSGALNAIGAKYIPGGDKLTGGLAKKISAAIAGEGSTEGLQSVVQQTGQTFLTEQGFEIKPKEVVGETLIGGGAGGAAVAATAPFTKAAAAAETKVVAEQVAPIAPETAQAVSEQANRVMQEAQVEETAETPEQRVARLQREAQEGVGIELEEEVPVSGLPPERIKSARWFESASRNRLKELQDKDDAGVEDFTTQERDEFEFLKASPTPEQIAQRYGYGVAPAVEPTAVTTTTQPTTPAMTEPAPVEPEPTLTPSPAVTEPTAPTTLQPDLLTPEGKIGEERSTIDQENRRKTEEFINGLEDGEYQVFDSNGEKNGIAKVRTNKSGKKVVEYVTDDRRGFIGDAKSLVPELNFARFTDATTGKEGFDRGSIQKLIPPATEAAPEAAVTPLPVEPPALAPLRRVVKAEQTEEDVSGLVGQGLVELYNGQPVITQAGLEALPEAERPRLTPEARKIQIDTRTSEAAAEAISKNLRIGVDQVPADVKMPAGWTLVGDVYIPPTKMAKIEDFEIDTTDMSDQQADVFRDIIQKRQQAENTVINKPVGQGFNSVDELRAAFDLRGQGHSRFSIRLDLMVEDGALTEDAKNLIFATLWESNANDELLQQIEMGTSRRGATMLGRGGRTEQQVLGLGGKPAVGYKPFINLLRQRRTVDPSDKKTADVLSTFWHEYGHMGYYSLLNEKQKEEIAKVYKNISRKERRDFFARGTAAARDVKYYSQYYAKSETEWFAQSFAEYVIKEKSDHKALVPIFEQILDRIKAVFGKLFGRTDTVKLNDIYDFILRGESLGKAPTWDGVTMTKSPPIYGTTKAQAIDPAFTRRLQERERAAGIQTLSPQEQLALQKAKIKSGINLQWMPSVNEYGNSQLNTEYNFSDQSLPVDKVEFRIEQFKPAPSLGQKNERFYVRYDAFKNGRKTQIIFRPIQITGGSFATKDEAQNAALDSIADIIANNVTPTGGTAPQARPTRPAPEARESRRAIVTPQQDRDYLDAVERGDLDSASRVVEDAAKAAGYTFGPVWHGTRKEFTRFFNQPTYFSESEQFARYTVAGKQGRVIKAYLRGNLFNPRNPEHRAQVGEMERMYGKLPETPTYQYFNAAVQNWLQENGWDGHYEQESTASRYRSLVVFDPMANAKSAEPVTRDDAGNIIPLSQRFQQGEADIRYARTERDPEVQKAAQDLKAGTIDRDEYQRIVDMRMPLRKFEAVPTPANNDDMLRGLGERKAGERLKKDLIQNPEVIAEGTVLESRLDIPAYENENVWVVSLHEPRPNINKGNAGPVVAYTPTSVLRNVEFGVTEKAAVGIAAGKPKSTIATMKGEYVPMTAEQAYELATTNKEQWVEIGMNPVRHSYFYDKDTQTPVVSAEEVVQVGGMVLAKNPVFGKREDYLYSLAEAAPTVGMTTDAVRARLEALGFGVEGMIRIVEDPQAAFEGRTIIQDGKAVRIELNASALNDNAAIDRVLNHEFAEAANADGALNKLVERLTPKEKKEINDAITRLGYEERVRTTEEAARAIETLAAGWKGRGFFERAVARVEAWGSKLGLKLTRRAAEYIAARNLSDINAGFKAAYNRFINVRGEAREGRAFVTPEENARFMELAKDPEANKKELQRMVDEAAKKAGYVVGPVFHTRFWNGNMFRPFQHFGTKGQAGKLLREVQKRKLQGSELANTVRAHLSIQNPLRTEEAPMGRWEIPNLAAIAVYEALGRSLPSKKEFTLDELALTVRSAGFDGIVYANQYEGKGDSYIAFDPPQIKSTDPVTYDDQGNVIPLDQRFQPSTADIRYARRDYQADADSYKINDLSKIRKVLNLSNIEDGIVKFLSRDLLDAKWAKIPVANDATTHGHCYVAAEAAYHVLGGKGKDWEHRTLNNKGWPEGLDAGETHHFIQNKKTGEIIDPTRSQFGNVSIPYGNSIFGGAFMGKTAENPSIRAKALLHRIAAGEPRVEIRESRREPAPTFTEESPEAKTLSNLKASMEKVDAASEAKGGKPTTQKVSEIAANWMESGGDERALQDAIIENTNLSPVNAAKVAKVIAKQYDIQQSIATAFLETQTGLSVEALPEGVTLPKEVDPDRPKPVMSRLFEVFMGVRVPPVKIEVNEKAALKDQIRLKAAANRAAKAEQKRTAEEVVEIIKAMELLGPVRPKQVQALAKRAARVIWTSEKSVEAFSEYAAKVVENANYDADLREAKDAQKRAKQLSTQKKVAMSPQREVLEDVSKVPVNKLDDPRMFAEAVNYYLRGFKAVLSPDYVVIPDAEMESYLSGAQSETQRNQRDLDREANERLARKYGIEPDQVNEMMESIDIIKQIEAQENREALENLLTEKAVETQQGLRGYDTDNLRSDQRSIVSSMLKVDPKALDPEERQRFIRITNNIIYNNQTNGAEYFVAVAKGQQSAREAAQDSTMISKNRAWINLLPRFVSERMQRGWALELQSIADTFRNAFGKGAMAQVYDLMGMLDLNLGFTKANNTIDEIQKKIADFHRGLEKKYKETARNQDGLLAEGIVGFLIQSIPKKDEVTSINQRRDLIRQDIANRKRSAAQPDRIAMADRIETILNRIDGESVEAVLNNMKREFPANHESLIWYKDTLLPQYKDFLKNFDENFNDQANNYDNPNYLTIGFSSAGPSLAITPEEQSLFYNQVSLNPKQSAYTIKRVDYSVLPKDRTTDRPKEIEFNLRRNVFNGLSDQINKAYTSSAWQRIASFMKTPEAEEVFGGAANKDFFIERLNRLRLSRMRRGSMGSGGAIEKAVDSLSVISRKLGTGIALGGIYQWIKQPPDQLITAWGSGGRGDLLAKNIAPSTQKLARELLNKFSIGRRGDASAGYKYINQMEGHQNRLERYFSESKWDQAKEQAGKIADVWMVALKSSDFLAASAAWMTYYEGELNKKDIKIDDWSKEASLIESDPARRQAAAFAEQMTDIYQGSSDPTSMATFAQSGKTGWENLVKAIFVPFNSFAIQQRMRLYSDAVDAINGNKSGVGGLAGTIGGLILFHATKRYVIPAISGVGIGVLYGLMGVDMDEPDEEKQKEEANKNWRQFLADLTGNMLVGGTPQLVETQVIDAMNRASYLVSLQLENDSILNDKGEIMSYDQYSKERSPFYRYKSYDNAMSLGMLDIGMGQVEQVALQTKMLASPEEMEMYTPEEQRMLYFSALSEWLLLMRLNDTDFARLVGKARRDMINAAKEREKYIKSIRSGR